MCCRAREGQYQLSAISKENDGAAGFERSDQARGQSGRARAVARPHQTGRPSLEGRAGQASREDRAGDWREPARFEARPLSSTQENQRRPRSLLASPRGADRCPPGIATRGARPHTREHGPVFARHLAAVASGGSLASGRAASISRGVIGRTLDLRTVSWRAPAPCWRRRPPVGFVRPCEPALIDRPPAGPGQTAGGAQPRYSAAAA
jgi:hypothetical protein